MALLQKLGPDAKLLSGGQSLIPMMKLRLLSPEYIVDINRIPNLDYITESDGHLKIGALAREHELESSEVVKQKFPILVDTAKALSNDQLIAALESNIQPARVQCALLPLEALREGLNERRTV